MDLYSQRFALSVSLGVIHRTLKRNEWRHQFSNVHLLQGKRPERATFDFLPIRRHLSHCICLQLDSEATTRCTPESLHMIALPQSCVRCWSSSACAPSARERWLAWSLSHPFRAFVLHVLFPMMVLVVLTSLQVYLGDHLGLDSHFRESVAGVFSGNKPLMFLFNRDLMLDVLQMRCAILRPW